MEVLEPTPKESLGPAEKAKEKLRKMTDTAKLDLTIQEDAIASESYAHQTKDRKMRNQPYPKSRALRPMDTLGDNLDPSGRAILDLFQDYPQEEPDAQSNQGTSATSILLEALEQDPPALEDPQGSPAASTITGLVEALDEQALAEEQRLTIS